MLAWTWAHSCPQAQLITPDLILLDLGTPTGSAAADGPQGPAAAAAANGAGGAAAAAAQQQQQQAGAPAGAAGGPGTGGLGGPQQSQYLAVYDWREARVRAFLASTSDAAVELLLE